MDYYKISPTAITCAKARHKYTDMVYSGEIFDEVEHLEEPTRNNLVSLVMKWMVPYYPDILAKVSVLEGRYLATNSALEKLGDYSVLEIAAGLSPRSLELASETPMYIETDLPEMIKIKGQILRKIRNKKRLPTPSNHYVQPLNPLNFEELEQVGELMQTRGNGGPLAIIHEGLFMYLNPSEQLQFRDNISRFLEVYSPKGAWVTPDISYRKSADNFLVKMAKKRIEKSTGRTFNTFQSENDIVGFISSGNLKSQKLPNDEIIEKLSCVRRLGLSKEKVKDIAKDYEVHIITLNH